MSSVSKNNGTRISSNGNLVVARKDGSQDVYTKDGRAIHQNAPAAQKDTYQPSPSSAKRPTPPAVRPTPPSADTYVRPTPPAIHEPRYYWQPSFPVITPNNPRPIPQIDLPPAPEPARQVGLAEVSKDPVELLAGYQRLREEKKRFLGTTHPEISAASAKAKLEAGETIFLAADGGAHLSKSAYQPVTSVKALEPLLPSLRAQKQSELQGAENRAYQGRVSQWVDSDVQRRINALPAFNSVYNTDRLALTNMMVTSGGRSFNRNMLTAMNVYNQPGVQREIAERWHQNPDMETAEFNRMANSIVTQHVSSLYWQSNYMGDMGSYLGANPVPGLRYPDTQEDADYNASVIRRVASELPILLNGSING